MKTEHSEALKALLELANLEGSSASISRFLKAHVVYFENIERDCYEGGQSIDEHVLRVRDEVRQLFRGGPAANEIAQKYLGLQLLSEVGNRFLVDHKDRKPDPILVDWPRGELRISFSGPDEFHEFRSGIYELLKKSRFAKVCARPDCPTPYFVASKILQQYCGTACVKWARLESANDYYRRLGAMKRRKRLAKQSQKQSKRKGGKR